MPPARLRSHFAVEPGGFRVQKSLRETVIFAPHNLLRDPPFSRLDLISCRNLLIYLDRAAQQTVLEMFHFALRPGGYLFLGNSESVDATARLFSPVDKAMRIFRANPVGRPLRPLQTLPFAREPAAGKRVPPPSARAASAAELHRQLLEEFAPPSVLVTSDYEIVHVSGRAVAFLRYAVGEPSHDLLAAVAPELRAESAHRPVPGAAGAARGRFAAARHAHRGARRPGRVVSVRPVRHASWPGEMLLVNFDDVQEAGEAAGAAATEGKDPAVARLEAELSARASSCARRSSSTSRRSRS